MSTEISLDALEDAAVLRLSERVPGVSATAADSLRKDMAWLIQQPPRYVVKVTRERRDTPEKIQPLGCRSQKLRVYLSVVVGLTGYRQRGEHRLPGNEAIESARDALHGYQIAGTMEPLRYIDGMEWQIDDDARLIMWELLFETGIWQEYVPDPTVLHSSTFTAADGTQLTAYTPDIGNGWEVYYGSHEIQSNQLRSSLDGDPISAAVTDVGRIDATVIIDNIIDLDIEVIFRAIDSLNYLLLFVSDTGAAIFYERIAGSYNIRSLSFGPVQIGDTISVDCRGSEFDLYINGTHSLNMRSSVHPGGTKFGLGGELTVNRFESFEVRS